MDGLKSRKSRSRAIKDQCDNPKKTKTDENLTEFSSSVDSSKNQLETSENASVEVSESAADEVEIVVRGCKTCECTLNDKFFICLSCISNTGEEKKEIHCLECIASHVKRGHKVTDEKDYEVSVCEKHKNLHSLFCVDCVVISCFQCVFTHVGHEMIDIAQKATETKEEIFKCLDSFDQLSKDVKFREICQKDFTEVMQIETEKYKPEKLKEILSKSICQNVSCYMESEKFGSLKADLKNQFYRKNTEMSTYELKQFSQVVENSHQLFTQTRNLLTNSDSFVIEKFSKIRDDINLSLKQQRKELKNLVCIKPFNFGSPKLKSLMEKLIEQFLSSIEWPTLDTIPFEPLYGNLGEVVDLHRINKKFVECTSVAVFTCETDENNRPTISQINLRSRRSSWSTGWLVIFS